MKKNFLISIDPGENTGWAIWDHKKNLLQSGWYQNSNLIYLQNRFESILQRYPTESVVIEDARMMGARTIASNKRFIILCKIIGVYEAILQKMKIDYTLISVQKWKGSLSNKILRLWIERILEEDFFTIFPSVHTLCAVGIGLHKLGRL